MKPTDRNAPLPTTDAGPRQVGTVASGLLDELAALMSEPIDGVADILRLDSAPHTGTAAADFLDAYDRFRSTALAVVLAWRAPRPGPISDAAWDALIDLYETLEARFARMHRPSSAGAITAPDTAPVIGRARSEVLMNRASVTLSGLQTVLAHAAVRHAVVALDR